MRWVAIILGSVLLLGVWILGILIPDYRWLAESVTLAVVLLIGVVFLVRWVVARIKAAAIERELMKQAAPTDRDNRPEVVALRSDMRRAVDALKRGRSGLRGGRTALYRLPWYVIVGPSAVGKTTAFERSGLSFVTGEAGSPKFRGAAGTRNCDWWFSQEAILLDTAGRFATEDADHDEWMAFLDTLRELRPDRPLDGIVVAVSVADLLAAGDVERERLAVNLRARLDEVLQSLEVVLPVYLILTKADLVAGFVDFWSDLTAGQRAQVWGASFDLDDPRLAEPARAIEAEVDGLTDGLHSRLLQRLPHERSPARRARIMQFPLEFRALCVPLGRFVERLCRPDVEGLRPVLRGFYLTSGTQVGRPVDHVLAGMMRGFEMPSRGKTSFGPPREAQSYFLTDVFRSVILPDRNLAARSAEGMERRSQREFKAALIALAAAVFVLLPAIVSYVHNVGLAHEVDAATDAVRAEGITSQAGTVGDPLELMLDTLDRLDDEASGFLIPGWFGPSAARELRMSLREAYFQRIHSTLELQVAAELARQLDNIAMARNLPDPINLAQDHTERRAAYDTLKLYATLADPKGHVDPDWTPAHLAVMWKTTLEHSSRTRVVPDDRLKRHASNYLNLLGDDAHADARWPAGPLRDARRALKGTNREASQLSYHWVLRRAYDAPSIVPGDLLDAPSLKYVDCQNLLVDGVYTKNGWLKISSALDAPLPSDARVEPWVLDDGRIPADEEAQREQIRKQYYDEYSSAWIDIPPLPPSTASLLDKCHVASQPAAASPTIVRDELVALKGQDGFYRRLFSKFQENVISDLPKTHEILGIAVPTSTEGCASKIPVIGSRIEAGAPPPVEDSPVQTRFQPFLGFSGAVKDAKGDAAVPLDKYLSELEKLTVVLEASGSDPAPDQESQFATTKHAIETLLGAFVEPTRTKMRRLLMAPVESTIVVKHRSDDSGLGKDWKTTVWTFWHDQLSNRWPFSKRAADVADYQDFQKFFQPTTGILWDFVNKSLKDRVELSGTRYIAKADSVSAVRADVLSCLNVAKEIGETFFGPDGGLRLGVWVDWSASDVSGAALLFDKKPTPLGKGQWSPVKWAGETEITLEWTQGGLHQDASGYHSFALFDLFKTLGGLKSIGSGTYSVQSPPITMKVRALGDNDAFKADFFSRLFCPDGVQAEP